MPDDPMPKGDEILNETISNEANTPSTPSKPEGKKKKKADDSEMDGWMKSIMKMAELGEELGGLYEDVKGETVKDSISRIFKGEKEPNLSEMSSTPTSDDAVQPEAKTLEKQDAASDMSSEQANEDLAEPSFESDQGMDMSSMDLKL